MKATLSKLPTLDFIRSAVYFVSGSDKSKLNKLEEEQRGSGYIGERISYSTPHGMFAVEVEIASRAHAQLDIV